MFGKKGIDILIAVGIAAFFILEFHTAVGNGKTTAGTQKLPQKKQLMIRQAGNRIITITSPQIPTCQAGYLRRTNGSPAA